MLPENVSQAEFLAVVYHGVPATAFIELRLLSDVEKGTPPIRREWISVGSDLTFVLDDLTRAATASQAALCFSVLPRRARGGGKNEDTIASEVVWADLDFKDFPGGEAEAREALAGFPIPPSIVVFSGHGLHAYWLLTEPCPPTRLSEFAKGIAKQIGGDSVHDAARVLRAPGSMNFKDPANPVRAVIETFQPDRRITPSDLADALGVLGTEGFADTSEAEAGPTAKPKQRPRKFSGSMPPEVGALLRSNPRLRNLFHGVGKPTSSRKGEPLDQSASGYDYSFIFELVKLNVRDEDILEDALYCRPDGNAAMNGPAYAHRTIAKVLAVLNPKKDDILFHLGVDAIRAYDSDPAIYEFVLGDRSFRVDAGQLLSPQKFCEAYVQVATRLPAIPHKKEEWSGWVNVILTAAERVAMPEDASNEATLRERIEQVIENLPLTSEAAELDGKALDLEGGRRAFRPAVLLRILEEEFAKLTRADVCRVLKAIGYESGLQRAGDIVVRLWARKGGA